VPERARGSARGEMWRTGVLALALALRTAHATLTHSRCESVSNQMAASRESSVRGILEGVLPI